MFDFATMLLDLSHGDVNAEITRRLKQVIAKVEATGKKGSLAINLTITEEGGLAVLHVETKSKIPEPDMAATPFFFGADGEVTRDDPRQLKLQGLASAPKPKVATFPVAEEMNDDE